MCLSDTKDYVKSGEFHTPFVPEKGWGVLTRPGTHELEGGGGHNCGTFSVMFICIP